jgi:hypothetical protein
MPLGQRIVDIEHEAAKRRLRSESARLRRRIDTGLANVRGETKKLVSWSTWVRRFPVASLAAAFGVGLVLSAGLSPRRWSRWLGRHTVAAALAALRTGAYSELLALWNESRPGGGRG